MDVTLFSVPIYQNFFTAIGKAFTAQGHSVKTVGDKRTYIPSDLIVTFGLKRSSLALARHPKNKPYIVLENGYVKHRNTWRSFGLNGLNGRANFGNENSPANRWETYFSDCMKPWKSGGEYVLLLGQVLNDASLWGYGVPKYEKLAKQIREHTDRPILFRPHPKATTLTFGLERSTHATLDEALAGAHCTVSVTSNSSVDSVLAGTPTIVLDKGSMAWDVAGHDFSEIENPPRPYRMQWAYNIAYTQWTAEELAQGHAVRALLNCM